MAAKASRVYTLFLIIALTVASLTASVTVAPVTALAGASNPTNNGDPDRPNDAPKPTTQPNAGSPILAGGVSVGPVVESTVESEAEVSAWSRVKFFIATLLGRYGL
ncbi:MAG: hypothetical protein ABIP29_08325 [Candidatus Eisenbacteria bacterium]